MQFAKKELVSCHKSNSSCEPTKGCEKEKCLLNFNFSSSSYIVFTTTYNFANNTIFIPKKENILYHKNFISNYNVTIWQPPESFSMKSFKLFWLKRKIRVFVSDFSFFSLHSSATELKKDEIWDENTIL